MIKKTSPGSQPSLKSVAQVAVSTDLIFKSVSDFLAAHYPNFSLVTDQSQVSPADGKAFLHIKDSSGGAVTLSSSDLGKVLTTNVLDHVAPGVVAEVTKLT